ncbi:hypothetical protein FF38_14523 [Lucilia cuprina]|uniref:Protein G12 n=1 Tax=Lucilia cuprina TaxID=7375 RepID=A0A0L0CCC5_LUCCU|nr:hypothetical protein CVS40_10018 [Lucilia cuprina]KNC29114.1 hypothetical protein FF38_14523 [Lucilia cuprina]
MKFITILGLIGICALGGSMAMVPPHNGAVVVPTPPPLPTLAQDLDEIVRMVPLLPIRRLAIRYLLNDEQFQAFVRIINSNDAFITQMRFRAQPEVMRFITWVRTQILLSGGEIQLEESEEFLTIINSTPFWSNTVFGWQGFVNEFLLYYPEDMIRTHVQMKVTQNGILAQFVQRLKSLKSVYDRVTALPEAQRVIAALQANGIDTTALDTFIRNQFGWQHPPTVAPPSTTAAPVVSSSSTPAVEVSSTTAVPSVTSEAAPVA